MAVPSKPSAGDTVVTGQDIAEVGEARRLAPTKKALREHYGESRIKDLGNGNWTVTGLRGHEAAEWMKPALRKQKERVQRNRAGIARETLRDEQGRPFRVQSRFAEGVARKRGLKPKPYWGRGVRGDFSGYDPNRAPRTAAEIAAERGR